MCNSTMGMGVIQQWQLCQITSSKPPAATLTIQEIEKQALIEALKNANGNVEQASKALGVSRATFYRKIKKYKIT